MTRRNLAWTVASTFAACAMGCGDDAATNAPGSNKAFQELYDHGLTRYVDRFDPIEEPVADEAGVKRWSFGVPSDLAADPRGPLCLRGGEWGIDTREGARDDLVIFLQGGGACWSEFCSAAETAGPLNPNGILNPDLEGNPVADWDLVYLPYCDGSLFAGDIDRELPPSQIGETDAPSFSYQRGLQNLTSALDVAVREFPAPDRILLTGVSGGAFGTIVALPLVRYYYPNADILVFNDSGIGVAKDGDPEFVNDTLLAGWNADGLIPASCPDCTENGHVTRFVEWQLERDPDVTMSALSYSRDFVIALTFLMVNAQDFQGWLLTETGRIQSAFPDRYRRFIIDGQGHTTLLLEEPTTISLGGLPIELGGVRTEVGGTTVLQWLTSMLDGSDGWQDLVDEGLE